MPNLFDPLPPPSPEEVVTELLSRPGVRIERIVSTGQATPELDGAEDEWVVLLQGAAGLWIEAEGERALRPGDHVFLPAHRRHRVTWTSAAPPAVWLAVHLGPGQD